MLLRFLSSKANNVAVSAFRAQILKFRFPGAVRSRFPNPAPCFIQIPHPENTLPDPVSLNPGGGGEGFQAVYSGVGLINQRVWV